jgi:hypothetical protein
VVQWSDRCVVSLLMSSVAAAGLQDPTHTSTKIYTGRPRVGQARLCSSRCYQPLGCECWLRGASVQMHNVIGYMLGQGVWTCW